MDNTTLQVGVKALLYNTKHQFLFIKRSAKYANISGQWDIPGGRTNPGTNLLDNLSREIKEETNLDLAYQPKLIAAQDIMPDQTMHIVRLTYLTRATGTISLQSSEATDYQWLPWSEITDMENLDPYVKEIYQTIPHPLQLVRSSATI